MDVGVAHLPTEPESPAGSACCVAHIYMNYPPISQTHLLRKLKCFLARKKKMVTGEKIQKTVIQVEESMSPGHL